MAGTGGGLSDTAVGAIIGGGFTVLGVVLSTAAGILAARWSHRRERARDLRLQRLTAYSEYLGVFAIWAHRLSVAKREPTGSDRWWDVWSSWLQAAERGGRIDLVASGPVRDAGQHCLAMFLAATVRYSRGSVLDAVAADELDLGAAQQELTTAMRTEIEGDEHQVRPTDQWSGRTLGDYLTDLGLRPPPDD
jgi:hypothetical protein